MDRLTRIRAAGPGTVLLAAVSTAPFLLDPGAPAWTTALSLTTLAAALTAGRSRPVPAALGVLAVSALDGRLFAAVLALSYLAGRRHPLSTRTLAGLAAAVATGTAVQLTRDPDPYPWLVWTGAVIMISLLPALIGSYRRLQAALLHSGWHQAAQLEREQTLVAEQARLQERARIARDMHDSLGHDLSLIALRAGALELTTGLAPHHRTAAADIRAGVTTAAERLTDIIGLLRDDDQPPPHPTGDHIDDLVHRAATAGVPVTLHVTGRPTDVAPPQYRTAYRVVQEALTNATKHATAAPVHVQIDHHDDDLTVTIRNQPPGQPPPAAPPPGGRGITGLRERVTHAGGTLHAGALPDGGYEITARLPAHPGPGTPDPPGLHGARRRARRGLAVAVTLPAALVTALLGTLMLLYAYDSLTSHLPPHQFRALTLGATRDDLAGHLPHRQVPEHRDDQGPPPPAGSTCEYYRSDAGFLPSPFDVYRLCFHDGRLVTKDVLPAPARGKEPQ